VEKSSCKYSMDPSLDDGGLLVVLTAWSSEKLRYEESTICQEGRFVNDLWSHETFALLDLGILCNVIFSLIIGLWWESQQDASLAKLQLRWYVNWCVRYTLTGWHQSVGLE
jgi:hypothetical protein